MARPLPQPQLTQIAAGLTLLRPLSHRGQGPGLIVLTRENASDVLALEDGVPSPSMKWAEEGYTVTEIRDEAWTSERDAIGVALAELAKCDKCHPKDQVGLIAYDQHSWKRVASSLIEHPTIKGVVVYSDAGASIDETTIPVLQHIAGSTEAKSQKEANLTTYQYSNVTSHLFATPFTPGFNYAAEGVSHTRNLTFLKRLMNGPYFDLEAIWDEHTYLEFGARDVDATMSTMVQEPYVNHIPTITGGIGRDKLSYFYAHHFVHQNPKDMELELVSRTVGIDRVIDEFIVKFTHDVQIDWLLPGVPPTYKKVEVPFTSVVNVRGDRLYHEHIAWDTLTVLFQLGLMPEYLPFPYDLPDGSKPAPGKSFEYRVPGAGKETAEKMRDKNSVSSNRMFDFEIREVEAPNQS